MFYKEGLAVRYKMLFWFLVYGITSSYVVIAKPSISGSSGEAWISISLLVTVFVSASGGIDSIADEKQGNRLGFLLSRPISRSRIYLTKVGVNILGWAIVYFSVSFVTLWLQFQNVSTFDSFSSGYAVGVKTRKSLALKCPPNNRKYVKTH